MFTPTFGNNGGNPPSGGGQYGSANNLAGIYQNALGRAPDAEGLAYYQGQMNNGVSLDEMRNNIWNSQEAQQYQAGGPQNPNIFDTAGGAYNRAVDMISQQPVINTSASNVTAGQLSNTNLDPYFNPYTAAVTDQALGDLGRSHDIAMNQTNSAASGAFGGSRHGVMQAETNRNFADATARTSSGLNSQNYSNAQAAAFQDIGNRLSADQGNQQAALAASMANASNGLQASSQLGNLSNLGFSLGNNALGAQANAGGQQQDLMQSLINAGKAQTQGTTGEADTALSRLLAAIGGVPKPTSTTQSSTPSIGSLFGALL